jgi:ferredoxin
MQESAGRSAIDGLIVDRIDDLVDALTQDGWRIVGPVVRDGAIALDVLRSAADLPFGLIDEQGPGHYRLGPGDPARCFDVTLAPTGWRTLLDPPDRMLWRAEREGDGFAIREEADDWVGTAFLGVRPCEIAAMRVQDRVLSTPPFADPAYVGRRRDALIVAVQCARAAATCFCVSMGTGPRARDGFDIALTELDGRLLAECGSDRGAAVLARLETRPATALDRAEAEAATARAAQGQVRAMPPGAAEAIRAAAEHPRWTDVAARCLGCGACALSCPTCFCTGTEDRGDLEGTTSEHRRVWSSCFDLDFSLVGGEPVRRSVRSRYRQWLTHKLATWWEQFGTSGCVGCGRCIAWCPVGIDITREAAAFVPDGCHAP